MAAEPRLASPMAVRGVFNVGRHETASTPSRAARAVRCDARASAGPVAAASGSRQLFGSMLTARAATSPTVTSEIADWASMSIFAHRLSGMVSVGENAVALVNDTYR